MNTMFKDIAIMIEDDQKPQITTLEESVDNTAANVENGIKELREAAINKNKSRKKKICLAAIGISIFSIIIGIVVWQVVKK